ncbi:hypothetical protein Tco_1039832, partial [Tanacetum coccineum]
MKNLVHNIDVLVYSTAYYVIQCYYILAGLNDFQHVDVIVNGDQEKEPAPTGDQSGPSAPPVPKTAKQLAAKRNQERVKSILLLPIPDEYLLKFHNSIGGSWCSNIEGRYQPEVPKKSSFFMESNCSIMRNKPDIDEIDIDDLYNNLRVYEDEMKSTASGDFRVSTTGRISQVSTTPCAHDVACSFFSKPTTSPQLENKDFQQIDEGDLEELDLRWQVAMLNVKSGRNQGRRSYGDNGRSNAPTNESSSQALVAQDGLGGYDWSNDFEVEPVNYALMAISSSSSSSSSDNE